jgi:hypothetical protein
VKPIGKGGGRSLLPFPMGFAVGGGRLDPQIDDFWTGSSIEQPQVHDFGGLGGLIALPGLGRLAADSVGLGWPKIF